MKLNCWEFTKCGRQAEGARQEAEGLCPATGEIRLDGIHEGISAGRACWAVAGTFSRADACCSLVPENNDCTVCDFYQTVRREEGGAFLSLEVIRDILG
jgi:hypothetical protein